MALGLGREILDQPDDSHTADDRNENHQWPPGADRREDIGAEVGAEMAIEENVFHERNQRPEEHRPVPRDDAHGEAESPHSPEADLTILFVLFHLFVRNPWRR